MEEKYLKSENDDGKNREMNLERLSKQIEKNNFMLKQKCILLLFLISILWLVLGVLLFDWTFEHMSSIFLVLALILMFFLGKKENEAIKVFMKGVSYFAELA